jgi:parvulin-like peptidyl-prolyl isomerase
MRSLAATLLITLLALGCKKSAPPPGAGSAAPGSAAPGSAAAASGSAAPGSAAPGSAAAPIEDLDSKDVLARTTPANEAWVRHVLIGWRDLESFYSAQGGSIDARAKARDNAAAAKLARELLAQLRGQPAAIAALSAQHSEDPGSKLEDPYHLKPTSGFAEGFLKLGLRLAEGESGIVQTPFGYHVMTRVPKPALDPLESTLVLGREQESGAVHFQHVMIGWDQSLANPDPRAKARKKADADRLASEVLAKVRAKGDMAALMKQHSEDPTSKDSARVYDADPRMPPKLYALATRLKIGEAGLVKTEAGWHVVKRVMPPPPPPPDKLESAAILARKPATQAAKVKHILVGWSEVNAGDDRAKARTRDQLDKLVGEILAAIKRGEKFEALMVAHSEDSPAAVRAGTPYDVTPSASLVEPFKQLSLRLAVNEVGVVKTEFGFHVIKRVE